MTKKITFLGLLLAFLIPIQLAQAQTISTSAGGAALPSGVAPYSSEAIGDGGPAIEAFLGGPFSLSTISEMVGGSRVTTIYIADKENNRIRQVSPDGMITTVVGNGTMGFSGDGGPATAASLHWPEGVAAVKERIGTEMRTVLYIADTHNDRVRRAVVGGTITTFAGGGSPPPGAPASWVGDGGFATAAKLMLPSGIAAVRVPRVIAASRSRRPVFMTRVYIADTAQHRVRKVQNNFITTVAGSAWSPFDDPDEIGDGGPATSARLSQPFSVAVRYRPAGDILYVADTGNQRIRKVVVGSAISTYVGGGSVDSADVGAGGIAGTDLNLGWPAFGVTVNNRTLYVSDVSNHRVYKVVENADGSTVLTNYAGNGELGYDLALSFGPIGDGGPALEAKLYPKGLDIDKWGNLFIADTGQGLIRKVSVP